MNTITKTNVAMEEYKLYANDLNNHE